MDNLGASYEALSVLETACLMEADEGTRTLDLLHGKQTLYAN